MAHDFRKELGPDVGHHLVADPVHAIRVSIGAEAAQSHDHWNGKADKKDRINFWAGVEGFKVRAELHRVGSGPVEDRACHSSDDYREKRIDHAKGKAQRQAQYETRLIRLDVTIKPPIGAGGCLQRLPE